MTSVLFETLGLQQAKVRFNRLGASVIDMSGAWESMLQFFFWIEDSTFKSQGRRGGGSWAQLTDDWLMRKSRMGLDPRINFATWDLYDAMTILGSPGQIIEMTPQSLSLGTDLPQAGPSQKFRAFVKPTKTDRIEMANIIRDHFRKAWNERA